VSRPDWTERLVTRGVAGLALGVALVLLFYAGVGLFVFSDEPWAIRLGALGFGASLLIARSLDRALSASPRTTEVGDNG
jgi:hypothetical protein